MTNLLIFGDSIAWGANDPAGGWAARLRHWLAGETRAVVVYNLGVCGDTSADLLARFAAEFKARRAAVEPNPIIFAIGLNDTSRPAPRRRVKISLSDFRQNIENLTEQALAFNEKIVFLGLTNIWPARVRDNFSFRQSRWYDNKTIAKYNQELKDFCAQHPLPFVDLFGLLTDKDLDKTDGRHPNSQGHKKIFDQVKKFLLANKFISF